jgi:YhcH/YjgK/YiaL family protein
MIFSTLSQSSRYAALHPLFPRAFEYIRSTDLLALAPGRYPIIGEQLFVIVENIAGRTREAAKLECHRKYIDIQLVLEGVDEMGWKALADCTQPVSDYKEDIQFFHDAPSTWIAVPPGAFCIFFPEDAHAPLVSVGSCDTLLAKPADCGSNCQGTPPAPEDSVPPSRGAHIRKAIFKIAVT